MVIHLISGNDKRSTTLLKSSDKNPVHITKTNDLLGTLFCLYYSLNSLFNSSQRTVINSKNGHATKTRNPPHAVGDTYRLNKTLLKINKLMTNM